MGGSSVQAQIYYWQHCYEWHGDQHQKSILLTERPNLLGFMHSPSPPSPSPSPLATSQLSPAQVLVHKKGLLWGNASSEHARLYSGKIC